MGHRWLWEGLTFAFPKKCAFFGLGLSGSGGQMSVRRGGGVEEGEKEGSEG